jgi:type IV pilus assembly protein PilY1
VLLGRVLFTTFTPIGDECAPGGTNWLYSLDSNSGEPRLAGSGEVGSGNSGALALTQPGSNAPPAIAPPIILTPPRPRPVAPGDGGGGDDQEPPCEGPDCPTPPPPTPTPPSVRDRQCVSNLGALTSDGIITFSNISCGRQSWRQID